MSRYTEIETATHNAYEDYPYENSQDFANGIGIGFRRGAEWADKTMLDKVYEWLKSNIDPDLIIFHEYTWSHVDAFIDNFREAMQQ